MEPTPTKPPKKRRRWLIVAFAVVLMSMVSWWYWPRGDARFVGKWMMQGTSLGTVYVFASNGLGSETLFGSDDVPLVVRHFSLDGHE